MQIIEWGFSDFNVFENPWRVNIDMVGVVSDNQQGENPSNDTENASLPFLYGIDGKEAIRDWDIREEIRQNPETHSENCEHQVNDQSESDER